MDKKLFVLSLLLCITLFTKTALAQSTGVNPVPEKPKHTKDIIEAKKLDKKAEILAKYLARYNSPLQNHAQDFIDAANKYNLDWKLVASIAGVESTFGRFIPGGYNGWGWGVYGTQAIYFNSWTDGIYTVSKGLRENYFDKGLTDPYSINKVYAASPTWGNKVAYFVQDLDKFASQFESSEKDLTPPQLTPQIAAVSGVLR